METPRILTKALLHMSALKPLKKPSIYDYKFEKLLGKGSYGEVYLARSNGKAVAIKKITKSHKWFSQNEIEAGYKLNHKSVIKLIEHFEMDDVVYLVMEYIDGKDLCTLYESRDLRPLMEWQVKKVFQQIVEAVMYIHLKGVAHLDLKLENVLIDKQNRIKLIDFGFCEISQNANKETLCKKWVGSKEYTDPMIILKRSFNAFKAGIHDNDCNPLLTDPDIWSLGIVLYVLLFAEFPWNHKQFVENLILEEDCPPLRIPRPVSKECESLLRSMLVVNPDRRLCMRDLMNHPWFDNYFKKYRRNSI